MNVDAKIACHVRPQLARSSMREKVTLNHPIFTRWPAQYADRLQLFSAPTPNGVKVGIMLEDEPHRIDYATFAAPVMQAATALIADTATERGLDFCAEQGCRFRGAIWLVAFLARASRRAASGNYNRLSTLWREVISLAGVARPLSKASSYRNF